MIHLKALPTAPFNEHTLEEIYSFALKDMLALENSGVKSAIVENMFDIPYSDRISLETLVSFVKIFTLLKQSTSMELGINIHATESVEEIIVAHLCGASFIRVENMVELRTSSTGIMYPLASKILRKKKELNSDVKIYADVMVKHSVGLTNKTLKEIIQELKSYKVDGIIISGFETGSSPSLEDVKYCKSLVGDIPLIIGSGVNEKNLNDLLNYSDSVIVGSSIKLKGNVSSEVSQDRVKNLLSKIS